MALFSKHNSDNKTMPVPTEHVCRLVLHYVQDGGKVESHRYVELTNPNENRTLRSDVPWFFDQIEWSGPDPKQSLAAYAKQAENLRGLDGYNPFGGTIGISPDRAWIAIFDAWSSNSDRLQFNRATFWHFYQLDSGSFLRRELADAVRIDYAGNIRYHHPDLGKLFFPFNRPEWLGAVANLTKYAAIGRISAMLESRDENPITGIYGSREGTVRTAAAQIAEDLRALRVHLLKAIDG